MPVDPAVAAAESRIDRLDAEPVPTDDGSHALDPGDLAELHVDDGDDGLSDPDEHGLGDSSDRCDLLDAFAEAFNARDLDGLTELLAPDAETPGWGGQLGDTCATIWERTPSALVTRGRSDEGPVGIVWEHDGAGWSATAAVHVAEVEDGRAGVVELSDDVGLLDEVTADPPDGDLDEGTRWDEWDEGAPT